MKNPNIAYEPHPVSAERKAELHAAGYRIIDARFAPAAAPAEAAPESSEQAAPAAAPRGKGKK